ncbi:Protein-glutamine gamma-glutamyltransferase [Posidoniimonas polymericola]|uniref:Protein-glutamine gamma-glutamyltransferase n=1 Tax=Posidoniimonas polymericola TaxID=2528002 RepID=A0A5C5YQE0_9BACT|nr:transglutaminase family protein [Posidoniimonas polymericola]TWT77083.1 Protein-glutamine gamma-glutamyltransferase [Posidoniimonas polymericola]
MRYRITHTTKYAYSEPVAVCHNLVHLSPRETRGQTRQSYRLIILPDPSDVLQRTDVFGNPTEYFSILEAHRGLSLSATSEIEIDERDEPGPGTPWEQVRDALPAAEPDAPMRPYQFAFPSSKAPLVRRLGQYAEKSFTPGRPIVDALRDLNLRINKDFEYNPQATTVSTPVTEAFDQRAGVCQDFAHVAISCLRSIGLAARYVSGYLRTIPPPGKPRLVGADASHAWLALYCGADGWVDADPTNAVLPGRDHITIAHGRDYADVCPIQGVYVGGGGHTMEVTVDVAPMK